MKVCIAGHSASGFGDGATGGSEGQSALLARRLAARGHEVTYVVAGLRGGERDADGVRIRSGWDAGAGTRYLRAFRRYQRLLHVLRGGGGGRLLLTRRRLLHAVRGARRARCGRRLRPGHRQRQGSLRRFGQGPLRGAQRTRVRRHRPRGPRRVSPHGPGRRRLGRRTEPGAGGRVPPARAARGRAAQHRRATAERTARRDARARCVVGRQRRRRPAVQGPGGARGDWSVCCPR